jgi:beta-glucosidase
VAQVYVRPLRARVERPFQELKAFQRVLLKRAKAVRVEMSLNGRAFSYWDEKRRQWRGDPGSYEIRVGSSSRDIRLKKTWTLEP